MNSVDTSDFSFILLVRKTRSLQGRDISTNLLIFDILFDCIQRSSAARAYEIAW